MAIEIPDSAAFYIRTGLNRGLMLAKKDIANLSEAMDNERTPEAIKQSIVGTLSHIRQWHKEAVEEYLKLPEKIRPNADLLKEG